MRNLDTTKAPIMQGPDFPSLQAVTAAKEAQRTADHVAAVREARTQSRRAAKARNK